MGATTSAGGLTGAVFRAWAAYLPRPVSRHPPSLVGTKRERPGGPRRSRHSPAPRPPPPSGPRPPRRPSRRLLDRTRPSVDLFIQSCLKRKGSGMEGSVGRGGDTHVSPRRSTSYFIRYFPWLKLFGTTYSSKIKSKVNRTQHLKIYDKQGFIENKITRGT